jgi:oxygen-independent coproporphyrinogen-3 oxidase
MESLGIYIQVPFCQTKCTYCNFHTGVVSADRFAPYVQAVSMEITCAFDLFRHAGVYWPCGFEWQSLRQTAFSHIAVDTVYIGGGTPSLLDASLLDALLRSVRGSFPCSREEVTLEADPETIEADKVRNG